MNAEEHRIEKRFLDYLCRCGARALLASASRDALREYLKKGDLDDSRIDLLKAVYDQVGRPMREVFPDGSFLKRGSEVEMVYRSCEDTVIKVRNARYYDGERTAWFNDLFGSRTRYDVVGEAPISCNGQQYVVLCQPYIEFDARPGAWERARRELRDDMKKRFGDAEEHPWRPNELHMPGWVLDDLKSPNVGIDVKSNHYVVVDCNVSRL